MTLASQLKKKSLSINLDRLKIAEKAKEAERIKAKLLAEKAARLEAIEIARKERERSQEKRRQAEKKRLIKWLAPGLLSAWNKEDFIYYNPCTDEELTTASIFFNLRFNFIDIANLNNCIKTLHKDIIILKNRFKTLRTYAEIEAPVISFEIESAIKNFKNQELFYNKTWRNNFQREAIKFENSAYANYSAKLRASIKNEQKEFEINKLKISDDRDMHEIINLAEILSPRVETFRNRYWSLLNSPASVYLINYDGASSEGVNFTELVASRHYKLAVARFVLKEMNIFYRITHPDEGGKFMSAFAIAGGANIYDSFEKHISDPELTEKFLEYKRILDGSSKSKNRSLFTELTGKDVSSIIDRIYVSINNLNKIFNILNSQYLQFNNGQYMHCPFVKIDDLSETSLYPEVDRLGYDIQWLRATAGQKFKIEFTKYLDELAGDGKYMARMKIFSQEDSLLIELPSGKEIFCDMEWDSFESLINFLELEIVETTSNGTVKLTWN